MKFIHKQFCKNTFILQKYENNILFEHLPRIRKSLRLLICNDEGILHMYSLDQEEGGDCSLIKQFYLVETKSVIDQSQILETTEQLVKQGLLNYLYIFSEILILKGKS